MGGSIQRLSCMGNIFTQPLSLNEAERAKTMVKFICAAGELRSPKSKFHLENSKLFKSS